MGQDSELLRYSMDGHVELFSTMRYASMPYPVITPKQVHGYRSARIDSPTVSSDSLDGFDALMTDIPGCAIGVRTADCVPVFLFDPVKKAVAVIHSGWKGTVQKICLHTINDMYSAYGTDASSLLAVIGPCIRMEHFQVREEVSSLFKQAGFPIDRIWKWTGIPEEGNMRGGHHIDLAEANRWILETAGVNPENIRDCGICTYEDTRFFSARREGVECGRIINAIRLL